MNASERRRLEEVLPFYVNGRASGDDRAFVDALLQDPGAAAMLEWHQSLAEHVRLEVEAVDGGIGWAALAEKVRAGRPGQAAPAPSPTGGWRGWLCLDRWLPRPLQVPAFAALALAVAVQGVLLSRTGPDTAQEGGYGDSRGAAGATAAANVPAGSEVMKVNFKDETPEHDMRLLLISAGATIIQGPGQLGDYLVSVPAERAAAARRELGASRWVNDVRQLDQPAAAPR